MAGWPVDTRVLAASSVRRATGAPCPAAGGPRVHVHPAVAVPDRPWLDGGSPARWAVAYLIVASATGSDAVRGVGAGHQDEAHQLEEPPVDNGPLVDVGPQLTSCS